MESRVFFPLEKDRAVPSLRDAETMGRLLAASSTNHHQNDTARTLAASSPCPLGSNNLVEERDDLYLVLPPPAGRFVGIKYRALQPNVADTSQKAGQEMDMHQSQLWTLWTSQKVEIKVTPTMNNDLNAALPPSQRWTKVKMRLSPPPSSSSSPAPTKAETPHDSNDVSRSIGRQYLDALRQCLLLLAQEWPLMEQEPGIVQALEAAAEALQKQPTSLCFVSVSKSRVKEHVQGGMVLEETDLILRDVTWQFFPSRQGQSTNENRGEQRHVRTWCMEGGGATAQQLQVLSEFATKSCPAALGDKNASYSVAAYPQFLTESFGSDQHHPLP